MTVNALSSRSGRVRVGAIDMAYDVRGAGDPVLLLPGLTMRRSMWPDALCDLLAASGFLVVRADNRDAGDSSRVVASAPNVRVLLQRSILGRPLGALPYRLEDMAADAFGLMSELGHERFHVAGASMGGMIAQTMAITRPERLRTMTSVMSTPGGRRYAVSKLAALRALLSPVPSARDAQIEHLVKTFRILNGDQLPFDEELARVTAIGQVDGGTEPAASARQLSAIFESSGRRRPLLQGVKTPTLVVHGSHDPLLPLRGAVAMARMVPGAELLVVRGMGHNFPFEVVPLVAGAIATHARRHARG